jgi:hypothetical protein
VLYICFQNVKEALGLLAAQYGYQKIQAGEFVKEVNSGWLQKLFHADLNGQNSQSERGSILVVQLLFESGSHDWITRTFSPEVLEKIEAVFDQIVIDIPGTFEVDYGEYLARVFPPLVFIVSSDIVTKSIVDAALSRYEMYGISPFGIILNRVPLAYIEHIPV